jgi:hypothetical protein
MTVRTSSNRGSRHLKRILENIRRVAGLLFGSHRGLRDCSGAYRQGQTATRKGLRSVPLCPVRTHRRDQSSLMGGYPCVRGSSRSFPLPSAGYADQLESRTAATDLTRGTGRRGGSPSSDETTAWSPPGLQVRRVTKLHPALERRGAGVAPPGGLQTGARTSVPRGPMFYISAGP